MPFDIGFYRARPKKLPESLPFELRTDKESGLIYQRTAARTRRALEFYYKLGGYASTPLGEGEYGRRQGDEVFSLLETAVRSAGKSPADMTFLEIGAGYGYLLYLLKEAGARDVLGLEPGDEGVAGARKYGIPIVKEFFPSPAITGKYDCVFTYGVLEHIENPRAILEEIDRVLRDDGLIFTIVPDCKAKFMVGDPSIISHQHVNYFTSESFGKLLSAAGFSCISVESYAKRAMLVATARKMAPGARPDPWARKKAPEILKVFSRNVAANAACVQSEIVRLEAEKKAFCFYGAGCAILKGLLNLKNEPMIVDGDPMKWGKKVTGFARPIQPPASLAKSRVAAVFVTPIDYDSEITGYLSSLLGPGREVISLKAIYQNNSGMDYSPAGATPRKKDCGQA